jgi:hypothetical protein
MGVLAAAAEAEQAIEVLPDTECTAVRRTPTGQLQVSSSYMRSRVGVCVWGGGDQVLSAWCPSMQNRDHMSYSTQASPADVQE